MERKIKTAKDILTEYETRTIDTYGRDTLSGTITLNNAFNAMNAFGKEVERVLMDEFYADNLKNKFKSYWIDAILDLIFKGTANGNKISLNQNADKNQLIKFAYELNEATDRKKLENIVAKIDKYLTINTQ